RWALSAMRSFTLRKSDSVRAIRISGSSISSPDSPGVREENAGGRRRVSPTIASVPSWPEPVERVASFLRRSGAEARIEEFAVETPTAANAARAAGCDLAQIVKTVVFDCGDRFVVALTPGDRRADAGKVAHAAKAARARVARAAQVVEATGFEPGAVAPFPLPGV